MHTRNVTRLIFSVAVCQIIGVIGAFFTVSGIPEWYVFLNKPSFTPPNWLFGPVWVFLYFLMGIALYLVLKGGLNSKKEKIGLFFFAIQLFLNGIWSFLFFYLRSSFLAFVDILLLIFFVCLTMYFFGKVKKEAFFLLIPYLFWISFASVLNFFIWYLN